MAITSAISDDRSCLMLSIEGPLSYGAYQPFMSAITQLEPEQESIVLDMSNASNVDGYGIGLLLLLKDYIGQRELALINSEDSVIEMLKDHNIDQYISLDHLD